MISNKHEAIQEYMHSDKSYTALTKLVNDVHTLGVAEGKLLALHKAHQLLDNLGVPRA